MPDSQKLSNQDKKPFQDSIGKNLEPALQCTSATINNRLENSGQSKSCKSLISTQSDGTIIKNREQIGLKQKLVSKVKSWSNKDVSKGLHRIDSPKNIVNVANVSIELAKLNLSDDNTVNAVKAKDSLESVTNLRKNKTTNQDSINSKSFIHAWSQNERRFASDGRHSDSFLGGTSLSGFSQNIIAWDPWNKGGRKNKTESKRRKVEKFNHLVSARSDSPKGKNHTDHTAGDEVRVTTNTVESSPFLYGGQETSYEYTPYHNTRKSVEFVNEVLVVYFTGDEIITKSTEPLKKEIDQQARNKEMRRGHIDCTMIGKKRFRTEDYMSSWFNKK